MLIQGDALHLPIADGVVQCAVTSPPYYGLRDYGMADQIGLEETPEAYVNKLVLVFREVKRVLKDDGVLFLNLGDSYATDQKGGEKAHPGDKSYTNKGGLNIPPTKMNHGLKPKDLIGIPWRVAFALQADGWWLRQDIVWAKPNPMPESVKDRCTKSHEYIFLLTKSERYYWDGDSIAEDSLWFDRDHRSVDGPTHGGKAMTGQYAIDCAGAYRKDGKRNCRDVWTIATKPYAGAHFATFPPEIPERCIKAGSKPGDIILDPFNGSGTTGAVAIKLGRQYVGVELKADYIELSKKRMAEVQPIMIGEPC
jgi:DNA modification methylase